MGAARVFVSEFLRRSRGPGATTLDALVPVETEDPAVAAVAARLAAVRTDDAAGEAGALF